MASVIATGGAPAIPPIPGLSDVEYWTNREAIEADRDPASMVILGGGAIGLEFAQVYRRFGTDVTIVEHAPTGCSRSRSPSRGRSSAGCSVPRGSRCTPVSPPPRWLPSAGGVRVTLGDGSTVSGERLLVATGRHVDLESLGVAAAGIDPSGRGIPVDEHLGGGRIWAVGDVTGVAGFTHLAVYQGRIAAADILGQPHTPADYTAVPRVTFTDPEVASVGLSEHEARERGIDVRTGLARTADSTRGYIHGPGAEYGVTKVIVDADRGVLSAPPRWGRRPVRSSASSCWRFGGRSPSPTFAI